MNSKNYSKLSSYQILAKVISHHLGDGLSDSQLGQLQEAINKSTDLVAEAELHGIAPLFYQFLKDYELKLDITPYIKTQFQALTLRHQHAAQARVKVIIDLIDRFERNNIPILFLKGAALANMIYSQPKFRPMRDIDILVPKNQLMDARLNLEAIGFVFDASHASDFMGGMHHLPNAIRMQDGQTISLEVHEQIFSRDVQDSQYFEQVSLNKQKVNLNDDCCFYALGHLSMLNHLCKHSFSHGEKIRLIHQYDILKYLDVYADEIDWQKLKLKSDYIVNTIRCLYYSVFIPEAVSKEINLPRVAAPTGIGDGMLPYSQIYRLNKSLYARLVLLFSPSAWWMHVYYNIAPEKKLNGCYISRHVIKVLKDVCWRLYYAVKHKILRGINGYL